MLPQSLITLGPLRSEEWRTIIEEPAKLVGLQCESGLVEWILKDVETQPDSLPLLEYALTELWKRKQGTLIAHAQYADIGGVEGAISKRADEVLACFSQRNKTMPCMHSRSWYRFPSIRREEQIPGDVSVSRTLRSPLDRCCNRSLTHGCW